jgi:hypothetical protein
MRTVQVELKALKRCTSHISLLDSFSKPEIDYAVLVSIDDTRNIAIEEGLLSDVGSFKANCLTYVAG